MTDVSNKRVGFVGLGDQGGPMALAIVEAGFLLHASASRPQFRGGAAIERHDDLASFARAVDVLALCLRDDQDIRDLIEQHGLLDALRPGATVVNHGTGDFVQLWRFALPFAPPNLLILLDGTGFRIPLPLADAKAFHLMIKRLATKNNQRKLWPFCGQSSH